MAHGPDWKNGDIKAHTYDVTIPKGYGVMKGAADDSVKLPTAAGVAIRGVTLEAHAAGEVGPVALPGGGTYEIVAGAAFAAEADLEVAASGKFITAVSTKNIVAKALEAATADGDMVIAQIKPSSILA